MERWKQLFVHTDGQEPIVFGVNLRECEWIRTGETAVFEENGCTRRFAVFKTNIAGTEYEFAYGEVSMCVYAFYVRQED